MRCLRCSNEDPHYFYLGSKGWYCRKCIQFKRKFLEEEDFCDLKEMKEYDSDYSLAYPLTTAQKEISLKVCEWVQDKDVLINAVCGAGKTEIVMEAIKQALLKKQRVCYTIARRQVVLEIAKRLRDSFKNCEIVEVCQGYTQKIQGDIIVCTTHQLYRYSHQFDLLILDEPDAFPYKGNFVLQQIAHNACQGHKIYMTATPDDALLKQVQLGNLKMVYLNRRPHGHDLIVPQVLYGPQIYLLIRLYFWLKTKQKQANQVLLFVPTIALANRLYQGLKLGFQVCSISSKTEKKDDLIQSFKEKKYQICITTTILERGITIKGIDVCILYADHLVFDEASLVQIIGRVGRSFDCPEGEGLFLCRRRNKALKQCIRSLKKANQTA